MKNGECLLAPLEEFSGEQKRRDQVQKINGEYVVAPPEEISFHKNVNKDGSKDQWRVLILPAVMAGFGTGRYTMCDLDLSRLRDYPGQDTAYSLRIIT